jgi:type I restriction enzyme S subunit
MAAMLFRGFFIDFDLPSPRKSAKAGAVPKGFRAARLDDVIEVFDQRRVPLSARERERRKGPYPYHGATSVLSYVDDYLFDGAYVLVGEDGSVINPDGAPVTQYAWGKFWVNNHAHVLRGKNGISTEHLLLHLQHSSVAPFITGAVQQKLTQANLRRIPFLLPPHEVCRAFEEAIAPLYAQLRANTEKSRTLVELREALLPRLISGELSATRAEHMTAAAD